MAPDADTASTPITHVCACITGTYGWMGGWMDGWMGGWMEDGWGMDGSNNLPATGVVPFWRVYIR